MARKVRINVTKKDIKDWAHIVNTKPDGFTNCLQCAVNKALKRKVPSASIGYSTIYLAKPNTLICETVRLVVSKVISARIIQLDKGIMIPPFSFTLEVPDGF